MAVISRPLRALLVLVLLAACGRAPFTRAAAPTSPRERYVQGLEQAGLAATALGRDWVAAGARALAAPAAAPLPLREAGAFAPGEAPAVAWRLAPRRGQRLVVRVEAQAADTATRVFAELFAQGADSGASPRLLAASDSLRATFSVDADDAGVAYLLRLQPELLRSVRWTVTVEAGPSLAFPVQGRDRRAVQSFWGADRDGGARSHQGIDIFAPRGTPVLAAGPGIAWAGDNRLGGKVVFVRDLDRGHSTYYAHLDSQAVASGAFVEPGDTIGFVGNTGNARSTAPHLHFGLYRRGEGAVDPFPFVDTRVLRAPALPARAATLAGVRARATRAGVVRAGPSADAARVAAVPRDAVVLVDAAGASAPRESWVRVRTADGSTGYLPAETVEPLGR